MTRGATDGGDGRVDVATAGESSGGRPRYVSGRHRPTPTPKDQVSFGCSDGEVEAAGDDESLDLAGALTDLEDLGVAVEAAHRCLVDEAVATEDLRRLAGG